MTHADAFDIRNRIERPRVEGADRDSKISDPLPPFNLLCFGRIRDRDQRHRNRKVNPAKRKSITASSDEGWVSSSGPSHRVKGFGRSFTAAVELKQAIHRARE
jgi:hypothetical protein